MASILGAASFASVHIYQDELEKACISAKGLEDELGAAARGMASRANALSSGFRTQVVRNWETGERMGGTQPEYGSDTYTTYFRKGRARTPVGTVFTDNYAARKDNLENNTLLKARK